MQWTYDGNSEDDFDSSDSYSDEFEYYNALLSNEYKINQKVHLPGNCLTFDFILPSDNNFPHIVKNERSLNNSSAKKSSLSLSGSYEISISDSKNHIEEKKQSHSEKKSRDEDTKLNRKQQEDSINIYCVGEVYNEKLNRSYLCVMKCENSNAHNRMDSILEEHSNNPVVNKKQAYKGTNKNEEIRIKYPVTPNFICKKIPHDMICLNRVKVCKNVNSLVAGFGNDTNVYIYEISEELKRLDTHMLNEEMKNTPVHSFTGHKNVGRALDWNNLHTGMLLSADNSGLCVLWKPHQSSHWVYDYFNYGQDLKSTCKQIQITDLQWIKKGCGLGEVFAFSFSDGTIRLRDNRTPSLGYESTTLLGSSNEKVNGIDWNNVSEHVIASCGDKGTTYVWDIRLPGTSVAEICSNGNSMISVSWHPIESSVLIITEHETQCSLWDLSVEAEVLETISKKENNDMDLSMMQPNQLLFTHNTFFRNYECKYHPNLSGIAMCSTGSIFNIFQYSDLYVE